MSSTKKPTNPFYILLVVAGIAFVLTSCCYFVMTVQGRDLSLGREAAAGSEPFVELVDRYGVTALMIELGILAAAALAAMATDDYWSKRVSATEERAEAGLAEVEPSTRESGEVTS